MNTENSTALGLILGLIPASFLFSFLVYIGPELVHWYALAYYLSVGVITFISWASLGWLIIALIDKACKS